MGLFGLVYSRGGGWLNRNLPGSGLDRKREDEGKTTPGRMHSLQPTVQGEDGKTRWKTTGRTKDSGKTVLEAKKQALEAGKSATRYGQRSAKLADYGKRPEACSNSSSKIDAPKTTNTESTQTYKHARPLLDIFSNPYNPSCCFYSSTTGRLPKTGKITGLPQARPTPESSGPGRIQKLRLP